MGLGDVLDAVGAFLDKYVVLPNALARDAVVLWAMHSWVATEFDTTPRLAVLSPEKRSGKTRLLEALCLITYDPIMSANVSPAVLFRMVDAADRPPTIMLDEVDTVFGPKASPGQEDLRGLLNAGYRRGAKVHRMTGLGAAMKPKAFSVFAPVVLAGIGGLPDTISDRAIVIRMRRRAPGETVAAFRFRDVEDETEQLRATLEEWGSALDGIGRRRPAMPTGVEDRHADIWEPLLAIADEAGDDWPERARTCAVEFSVGSWSSSEFTLGVRLLDDIRGLFTDRRVDRFTSRELCAALIELEEAPWGDFFGREFKPRDLARRLGEYEISSKAIRVPSGTAKGYLKDTFIDAWVRYLPAVPKKPVTAVTTGTDTVDLWGNTEGDVPSGKVTNSKG